MPEWKGRRGYRGFGRVVKGPGVTLKSRGGLGKAEAPVQVVQAFVSAMNGLVPRVPVEIDELYDALAAKYGTKKKAAEAVGVVPRTIERYIVAERKGGAHGGKQARGNKLENREALRLKMQQIVEPAFVKDRDAAIAANGVQVTLQGTLRIDSSGHYFERRFVHIWIPGHFWRASGGKGRKLGILDAWDKGWTKAATIRFQHAFAETYGLPGSGWTFIEEMTFEPPN